MANENYGQMLSLNELAEDKLEEIDKAYEVLANLLKPRQSSASNSEPRYVISVASRIVGIEAHTLRYYERLGLVQPRRSGGNTRLYSQDDIDQLCCIKSLMSDLKVNLAGVEVALHLARRMEEMQQRVNEMEDKLKRLVQGGRESD
jgi:MerR family transcriptional regulator/heat shock protein HspR